ncbi:MAG TPA: PadR family transcriptional regulator [Edaphocola sp.]|nr:PadR family transcriptional regulator [Edaphocola sp.]
MEQNNLLIKGSLTVIILRLLQNNGKLYGYEIMNMVRQSSKGRISITDAALYKALHKLHADGYIIQKEIVEEARAKKFYLLSRKGRYAATTEALRMKEAISQMQKLLRYKR